MANSGIQSIALPKGWAFSQWVAHCESEDLSRDANPFAANIVMQLRVDAPFAATGRDVAAADLQTLKGALDGFELLGEGSLEVGSRHFDCIELTFRGGGGQTLQQLTVYLQTDTHLYAATCTHVRERFGAVREQFVAWLGQLLVGG